MSENPETAVAEQEVADSEAADTPMVEGDGAVEVEAVAEEVVADEANEPDTAKTDTVAGEDVIVEATETEVAGAAAELEAVADEASETDTVAGDDVIAEATETDGAGAAAELVVDEADAEVVESEAAESETGDIPTQSDSADSEADKSESGRVVRVLSVGMEVTGTVKRTTDFGAFVDIGVGRDGLIHISELSTRRVAKVTDVLKQGQEVTAWIKELDRSRNRISLTLIPPGTKTIRDLQKDEIVTGTVTRIVPYGAFVDIGVGRDALLHIREMSDGYVNKPEDVVQEGETVEARIIEISRRRGRIDLSMKGLGPEPEAEAAPDEAPEDEGEPEDPFENMEVLSPMELAFQKAMNEGDEEVEGVTRRRSKRARREQMRSLQDEIISRTLKSGGPR